jgi:hypothetical protein
MTLYKTILTMAHDDDWHVIGIVHSSEEESIRIASDMNRLVPRSRPTIFTPIHEGAESYKNLPACDALIFVGTIGYCLGPAAKSPPRFAENPRLQAILCVEQDPTRHSGQFNMVVVRRTMMDDTGVATIVRTVPENLRDIAEGVHRG